MSQPKSKVKSFFMGLLIFLIMVFVMVMGSLFVVREFQGARANGELVVVNIPEGSSGQSIASILKKEDVIDSSLLFRLYIKLMGNASSFQLGDHQFMKHDSYHNICEELASTTYKEVETIAVTFPEGTTALGMAYILSDAGLCTVDDFVNATHDVYDVSFYNEISNAPEKFIKLEGFLYPDTYEFEVGASAHDIVEKMLKNFDEKIYNDTFKADLQKRDMTLEEAVILASIVEKETLGDEMYAAVAGVFINRLNDPNTFPHLESDTSASHLPGNFIYGVLGLYYNGDIEPYERAIPPEMVISYDTYLCYGLPVGAICNPGYKALQGTVEPAEHNFYFFITDCDTNYYWGTTANDHAANIEKVRQYNNTHSSEG